MRRAGHGDRGRLGVGHDGAARLHLERAAAQRASQRDAARVDPHGVLRVRAVGDVRREHLRGELRRLGGLGLLLVPAHQPSGRADALGLGRVRRVVVARQHARARVGHDDAAAVADPAHGQRVAVDDRDDGRRRVDPARAPGLGVDGRLAAREEGRDGGRRVARPSVEEGPAELLAREARAAELRRARAAAAVEDARHGHGALRRHDVRVLHGRALALHSERRRPVRGRLLAGAAAAQLPLGGRLPTRLLALLLGALEEPARRDDDDEARERPGREGEEPREPARRRRRLDGRRRRGPAAPRERAAHAFEIFDHGCQLAWICLDPYKLRALARRVQRAGRKVSASPFSPRLLRISPKARDKSRPDSELAACKDTSKQTRNGGMQPFECRSVR